MQVRIDWDGRHINDQMRQELVRALADGAEYILQESNKIAPLDEGTLTRSGNIDMGLQENKPAATVFYDTPYAARLHEHPEYNFQNGREGKYLEKVFNREITAVRNFIAQRLRHLLG